MTLESVYSECKNNWTLETSNHSWLFMHDHLEKIISKELLSVKHVECVEHDWNTLCVLW